MATTLLFKSASAVTPKPSAMVDTTFTFDFGTYVAAKDMLTDANGGTTSRLDLAYLFAQNNNQHHGRLTNFLSPQLAAQTIASQTWAIKLWGLTLTALDPGTNAKFVARLFIWDDDTNALDSFIGAAVLTAALSTISTAYTLNVVAGATIEEGQRLGCDVYVEIQDSLAATAVNKTVRFQYGSTTNDSGVTSPATLQLPEAGVPLYGQAWTP